MSTPFGTPGSLRAIDQLSPEVRGLLERLGSFTEIGAGSTLTIQDEPVETCFWLRSGLAVISIDDVALAELAPGDIAGGLDVLNGSPATATVTALDAVGAVAIEAPALQRAVAICPTLVIGLLRVLAGEVRDTMTSIAATAWPSSRSLRDQ